MATIPATPVSNTTPPNAGFLNLITVLLGWIEPSPLPGPNPNPFDFSQASDASPEDVALRSASPQPLAQALIRSMLGDGSPQPSQPGEAEEGWEARARRVSRSASPLDSTPLGSAFVDVATAQPAAAIQPSALPKDNTQIASPLSAKPPASAWPIFFEPSPPAAVAQPPAAPGPTMLFSAIPSAAAPVPTAPLGSAPSTLLLPAAASGPPAQASLAPAEPVAAPTPPEIQVPATRETRSRKLNASALTTPLPALAPVAAPVQGPAQVEDAPAAQPPAPDEARVLVGPAEATGAPRRQPAPPVALAFSARLTPLLPATRPIEAVDPKPAAASLLNPAADPPRPSEFRREVPGEVRTMFPIQADREDTASRAALATASSDTLPEPTAVLASSFETHAPTVAAKPSSIAPPAETPFHATTEAIRTAEPISPPTSPPRTWAAQELNVRIAQPDTPAVDVHVVQRAGQVQVAVRTPDATLQTSLRQDLSALVNSLEHAGYRTETFAPREAALDKTSSSEMNSQPDRQDSKGDSSGRGFGDASHGRHHQHQRDAQTRAWLEDLEQPA